MAGATQRFMSIAQGENNPDKQIKIFNVSIILHFIIAIAIGIILIFAGIFFFNGILNIPKERIFAAQIIYGSLIISTILTIMTTPYDAVMNAHENMKYYAIIGILESLFKLFVALIITYIKYYDKLIIYGILMAIIPIITLIIMRIYCKRQYKECIFNPRKYWDKSLTKSMSTYAGWSFVDASTGITANYGLGIVLNHFWGTILNAAQGIANQVGGQLMMFSQNMIKAINPVIMKSEGAGDRKFMLDTATLGCKYSFSLLAFFAIPFILESTYVLKIWLKEIPEWAVLFCRLQLIRSLIEQMTINLWSAIAAQGDVKQFYTYKSILNFLPLILAFWGFKYGLQPYWLYIFWILCWGILTGILIIYFAKKKCNLSIEQYIRKVFYPCLILSIITFTAGCIPHFLLNESFLRLLCSTCTCIVVYLFTFWNLLSNKEQENLQLIVKNIIHKWKS